MYELRKIFARNLQAPAIALGLGPIAIKLIMRAFDEAVEEAEEKHRAELARAGMIPAA